MGMETTGIIVPARLGSQRFPRKLLHPVLGTPLILWTAERIRKIAPECPLFFAVAELELQTVLESAGFDTVLTDPQLPSGTDRIRVANQQLGFDRVINVQADEPLIHPTHIATLKGLIEQPNTPMATLVQRFQTQEDFRDPHKVKAVISKKGQALYFSRHPIPFDRDKSIPMDRSSQEPPFGFWHLGLYAYTASFLETFANLVPSPLEKLEKLEQLRALEHGYPIRVAETSHCTQGVDVPEDLEPLEKILAS